MSQGDRPDEPRAEMIELSGAGRPLGPIGGGSGRSFLAIVGLVVVLGIAGLIGLANLDRSNPRQPPGPSFARPSGLAVGPGPSLPATAWGLPVVSVDAALQAFDANPSGEAEVAVGGWYSGVRLVESCQASPEPAANCVSGWNAVLESRPDTVWSGDGTAHPTLPGTSVLNLRLIDPIVAPDLGSDFSGPSLEVVAPSRLVLVGHFGDDRVTSCAVSPAPATGCRSIFVVDAIPDRNGSISTTPAMLPLLGSQLTTDAVSGLIRANLQPGGFVLSFGAVVWTSAVSVQSVVEPSPVGPPPDGRTVWLVRGYLPAADGSSAGSTGGAVASWMAIDDVTGQVWGPLASPVVVQPLSGDFPATMAGLPVQSVGEALARGPDPSGLTAVAGYLSNDRAVEGCPPAATTDKPNPCSGTQLVLDDQSTPVLQANDATFLYDIVVPPGAPSIRPVVLPGTSVPDPWAAATDIAGRLAPRRVVLLGQFGDRRSPECAPRPGGGNAGCDRSFVVDQIAWIEGAAQGPSLFNGSTSRPVHDQGAVSRAVAGWFLPGETPAIVSITSTLPEDAAELTGVNLDGRPHGLYWVVLVVSTPPSGATGTYLVFDDATLNLVEVSAGG
ncbi:MAG TPA: hypothetical protein VKR24_11230 [Candidatus Limnocylindrales bacterium]|nr:hypothetical protein [Candidatus Limnocylindrales bacterium]